MRISPYQQEQHEAIALAATHLDALTPDQIEALKTATCEYLMFRDEVDAFLNTCFASTLRKNVFKAVSAPVVQGKASSRFLRIS